MDDIHQMILTTGYESGKEDAIKEIFNFLKKNYLIKSIEPIRWVSWDKVKQDFLNSKKK